MDLSMSEWRKSVNMVLVFIVFLVVGASGFSYLYYVEKPTFSVSVDVAIVVSFVCSLAALFFLFRSMRKKTEKTGQKEQEVVRGYYISPEEPFGC